MIVAAVVAMVASTGGFALASVLTVTTIQHNSQYYGVANAGAVNGYGTPPTLDWTKIPYSGCQLKNSTQTPASVYVVLSNTTGGVCTQGDFAAEFSFAFSSVTPIITQTNTFTVISQIGSGSYEINTVQVTLGANLSGPLSFSATVDIFVDFGVAGLPAGSAPAAQGVSSLNILVQ